MLDFSHKLAAARSELKNVKEESSHKSVKITQLLVQLETEKKKLSEFQVMNLEV